MAINFDLNDLLAFRAVAELTRHTLPWVLAIVLGGIDLNLFAGVALDDDAGDDRVEHGIGETRRLRRGAAGGARPELLPALRLGAPPARDPRLLGILGGDVDLDAEHLEAAGAVDRRDAAVGAVELRPHQPRSGGEEKCGGGDRDAGVTAGRLHGRLFGELDVEIQAASG